MLERVAIFLLLAWLPPLEDLQAFPTPRVVCNELLHFNQAYCRHLNDTLNLYQHRECLREAIRDTELRYKAWDALRDAQQTVYSDIIRRQALATLRNMIGQEAYERGQMPEHVPLWRFAVIRGGDVISLEDR